MVLDGYLGEWQTRKVATVQRRIVELDRLVFSPLGCDRAWLCAWAWPSLRQMVKLRRRRMRKGRREVRLTQVQVVYHRM